MTQEIRIAYLNPRDLLPSKRNVRSDPGDLAGLAETIREHGLLQPLGVTREGDGYRVVYGNRRRDAAIVVGLDRVPCLILDDVPDEDAVVQQVLENLQRLDLNDMDKSRAFEQLVARALEGGATQSEALDGLARSLGLSARQIQRYLRLRQLAPEVQQLIAQGELGVTQAQHRAELRPAGRQVALARLAVEESLASAELARLCVALQENTNIAPELALQMLRRGGRVPIVLAPLKEGLPHLGPEPTPRDESAPWEG
ncbi:MAG: ParB/RepB/Spo0J family partition protein, partial [Chloroflexota bacterium]